MLITPSNVSSLSMGNRDNCSVSAEVRAGDHERVSLAVRFATHTIEHLSDPFRPRRIAEGGARAGTQQLVLACLDEGGRRVVKCRGAECISVAQIEGAEVRPAQTGCICQYGLEHGL